MTAALGANSNSWTEDAIATATIVRAVVVPGHDGSAELFVEVAFPAGGRVNLTLGPEPTAAAVAAAGVNNVADLVGKPWQLLVGGADGVARLTRGE